MMDYLLTLVLFGFTLMSFSPHKSIISTIFMINSLSGSVEYFLRLLVKSCPSFWIDRNQQPIGIIDRYFYFVILTLVMKMFDLAAYGYLSPYLPYFVPILSFPAIAREIMSMKWFHQIRCPIYAFCGRQFNYLICLIGSHIFNHICLVTINLCPKISPAEISSLLNNIDRESVMTFIRIFVFSNIVETLGAKRKYIIPFMRHMFNMGNVLDEPIICKFEDPYPSIQSSEDKIRSLILHRNFDQFYNPEIQMELIHLYHQKAENSWTPNRFAQIGTYLTKFSAFYSLNHLLNGPLISEKVSPFIKPLLLAPIIITAISILTDVVFEKRTWSRIGIKSEEV